MAVLMTYHKLVERDAKNIDVYWKVTSIILLVLGTICSLILSFSLQKISTAFGGLCPLDAQLEFENVANPQILVESSANSFSSAGDEMDSAPIESRFANLSDFFIPPNDKLLRKEDLSRDYPIEQVQFLANYEINDRMSAWGKKSSCDFGVYIPICQSCFAIIMAVMFIMCGRGGKTEPNAFLPQPWRIVSPALIFFLVMTIVSIVNLVLIQSGMSTFCESFERHLPDVSCDVAMNRFKTVSIDELKVWPGVLRQMLSWFNYISFSIWLLSLIVLLARIMFVIDFQLVRVTVKTIEYEKANETSLYQVVEVEENGKDEAGQPLATTTC